MNQHYADILALTTMDPRWWDERAVPRFCRFSPDATARIYAEQVALLLIRCQNCGREFPVAMSWDALDGYRRMVQPLDRRIRENSIHYGDPPNALCCPAGPTMNSISVRVVEFWRRGRERYERDPSLEVEIHDPDDDDGEVVP